MSDTRIIRLFEDKQQKVELNDQEMKDILWLKNIVGNNNLILQVDGSLLIRHFVGFVQINKTRVLIYPKISRHSSEDNDFTRSFDILLRLLSYSDFDKVKKIPTSQNMDRYDGDLLELFVGLFIDELLFQFKRDINRGYINQVENQSFIKGKVDFTQTIKRNSFKKHLHYVQFDEFNENVLMNRIFKSVILNLITRTTSRQNKMKLKQSLIWLEDVEILVLNNEIWEKVDFTRQNKKYEVVFNMAKLFYYNSSPNLNIGDESTFSFLLPVNDLFELYLFKVIGSISLEDVKVRFQSPRKYMAQGLKKKYLHLKPDITLSKNHEVKCVIDAKYKELVFKEGSLSTSSNDIYQMLGYSVVYQCNNIVLIYPKFITDNPDEFLMEELKIKNYDQEVSVKLIKVDLEMEPSILAEQLIQVLEDID